MNRAQINVRVIGNECQTLVPVLESEIVKFLPHTLRAGKTIVMLKTLTGFIAVHAGDNLHALRPKLFRDRRFQSCH